MFISKVESKEFIWVLVVVKAEERKCIFPRFLLGATIQDGGIRERRARLRDRSKEKSYISLTQENSVEFQLQSVYLYLIYT